MTQADARGEDTPATALLETTRARLLGAWYGRPRAIAHLVRAPSPFRSSFLLEEIDVRLDDDLPLALIFKDVGWSALTLDGRRSKPHFLYRATREIAIYRTVLADAALGTATCYGAVRDNRNARYWLFLERVPGVPLYAVGDFAVWQQAARWLATLHGRFAARVQTLARGHGVPLMYYDATYYRRWMRRAGPRILAAADAQPAADAARLRHLVGTYERVVAALVALPPTLLHGECYASNVLVDVHDAGVRVCPVDWEMAAIGPAYVDLAALIAGSWTEGEKSALAHAYRDAARRSGGITDDEATFRRSLAYCRLHIAVQWLGWSSDWVPPQEHAYDWIGEIVRLTDLLGF